MWLLWTKTIYSTTYLTPIIIVLYFIIFYCKIKCEICISAHFLSPFFSGLKVLVVKADGLDISEKPCLRYFNWRIFYAAVLPDSEYEEILSHVNIDIHFKSTLNMGLWNEGWVWATKSHADVPLGSKHLNSCGDSLRFLFSRHTLSLGYSHICLPVSDKKDTSNAERCNWTGWKQRKQYWRGFIWSQNACIL